MSTAIPPPPKKRRWKLRALIVGSLLLAAGMVAAVRWAGSVQREMDAIAAELDARDPGWRLADIEAARRPVADAHNAALKIMAIVKRMKSGEKLRDEAFALKDFPQGRFPVEFGESFRDLETHSRDSVEFARMIQSEAAKLCQQGKHEEALVAVLVILNAARAIGDEPFLISRLVRSACHSMAVRSLANALSVGEVADDSLRTLQAVLTEEAKRSERSNPLRGERALWYAQAESIFAGRAEIKTVVDRKSLTAVDRFYFDWAPTRLLKQYPDQMRAYNDFVEAGKLPTYERRAKHSTILAAIKRSNPSLYSSFNFVMGAEPQCMDGLAQVHCAVVGVACERYRLAHQRWPATVDAMVANRLLDAVLTDPRNNTPLRLLLTSDGLQVQSSGLEAFRLWNPPSRRQPAVPVSMNGKLPSDK